MGLLLALSRVYLPHSTRENRLGQLFRATADAFRCEVPELKKTSFDQRLTEYALFTAKSAGTAIKQKKINEVKERLYSNARWIGQNIREELNLQTMAEVMQACVIIYRALKIEFHGNLQGQIFIPRCFFSSFYSSEVCHVISSLDEGLIAGLSKGYKLEFSQRITEGKSCCKAHMLMAGSSF